MSSAGLVSSNVHTHSEIYQGSISEQDYQQFKESIKRRFSQFASWDTPRAFTTAVEDLFQVFLDNLPSDSRQHYNCNACKRFINTYGSLVAIDSVGEAVPIFWDENDTPASFRPSVKAMIKAIQKSPVTGVFISSEKRWGLPVTGTWTHFAVILPDQMLFRETALKNASQAMAEKLEDFKMLQRGLEDFPYDVVVHAQTLLTNGQLYRSEKCEGVANWLSVLHSSLKAERNLRRQVNLIWKAVASAPTGYCHVRSSMIGTLLEDLVAKLPFDEVKRKFDAKMNPLQYQRPQAAPSAGNIAQAEKVISELKATGSLNRRFAKLEDLQLIWQPQQNTATKSDPVGGVFSHLKTKEKKSDVAVITGGVTTMTWEKFVKNVLSEAIKIEFEVPYGAMPMAALVTAQSLEAPPILQWDNEGQRAPVSWYLYAGGSSAAHWKLSPKTLVEVSGISLQPSMWFQPERFKHLGESVFFILQGAQDTRHTTGGLFFPESLKSEFHPIRATIEAYAKSASIAGKNDPMACGLKLEKGHNWDARFHVTNKHGIKMVYKLDRWD